MYFAKKFMVFLHQFTFHKKYQVNSTNNKKPRLPFLPSKFDKVLPPLYRMPMS